MTRKPSDLKNLDKLIHEPARLMIISQLYVVESADFLFLQHQLEITPGNLSSHLSKLEDAGYVEIVKEFIEKKTYQKLYLKAKGGFFRNKRHIKLYLEEYGLLKKKKK